MLSGETLGLLLSVTMVCIFALLGGAIMLFRRGNDRKRAWLMLGAAAVLFVNVLIWSLPVPG